MAPGHHSFAEQVPGHLKDEFCRKYESDSSEQFKSSSTRTSSVGTPNGTRYKLGYIPEEFRNMSLAPCPRILIKHPANGA
ncbi:hypothetical protein G1C95_2189 [Bifidobacterium sp. DSM 109957]|uniref:Uncharacterized protein n=1 Tax=Bifidobacterium oedipodis TaxID=2675322 RepID=A0A7Y0ERB1_9BIFI|nr:hypothetical protein [Bifidobacterium sp. DSM 109957]